MHKTLLGLALVMIGCGGAARPTSTGPGAAPEAAPPPPPAPAEDEAHAHPDLPPALAAFHDVLAPRWHMEPGPARFEATCEAIDDLVEASDAVKGAPPPATVEAEAWAAAADELETGVVVVAMVCEDGSAQFDEAFASLHDDFHRLLGLLEGAAADAP
ncbi:MAG: hypothetical protein R2939_16705 [Kofleriaceae bacterium]